ncbi:PglL family O-oligosaccharyltransferase [Chromobacterium alticapitis]|uniref:Virulence factor membrane-bound polymerase C-terminal domain-containing protein n=1 Tax=Chromobacterium alticapitis TaxID=2073169 RepID=A0A2S5DJU4_9NEIS|nr:O-antigen ligase family protein [Chromobacterium alticapitis]POZ63299.1 hypothetical protein C2I19_05725 [Chromobacterium alticapitis]
MKSHLSVWFIAAAVALPFLNPWHYAPNGDWVTNSSVLFFISLYFFIGLKELNGLVVSRVFFPLLMLSMLFLTMLQYGFPAVACLFLFLSCLVLCIGALADGGRAKLVDSLAWMIIITSLIQSAIGLVQALGMAGLARGWILFNKDTPLVVIGNFGQRNLLAEFLCWGMISSSYLYGVRRLSGACLTLLLTLFAILIAWTSSRMPVVYSLGFIFLVGVWYWRARMDDAVARMGRALLITVFLLLVMQVLGVYLAHGLNSLFHFNLDVSSGFERLQGPAGSGFNPNDVGAGPRRLAEWRKAWHVFLLHPWFGVGLGGYAWQSAWLQVYGDGPIIPLSELFIHCHNLILQLLAETGLVGTAISLLGLMYCIFPFFRAGQQTVRNLFLICIAMTLLCHSMVEYPLWYLPFLLMLVLICGLSPAPVMRVGVSQGFFRGLVFIFGVLGLAYVVVGMFFYWKVVDNYTPTSNAIENMRRSIRMTELARNPLWAWEGDMGIVEYLEPSFPLALQRDILERVARYQPFPGPLIKLAIVRGLDNDAAGARQALVLALINYPDNTPRYFHDLARYQNPELKPLQELAHKALIAGSVAGGETDAGRKAIIRAACPAADRGARCL